MSTSENNFEQCTKEQLEQFVRDYPGDLEIDVAHMYDPPLQTYNDFSDGRTWPESSVAQVVLGSVRPEEADTYYLRRLR